jgi:aryl-alcohol dehydrogenase-like predicted oxidoreductase
MRINNMPNNTRLLAKHPVSAVSLGCMSLSHGYGEKSSDKHSDTFLSKALDLGYTMLDTAAVYGYGHNESMIGKFVSQRRSEFFLASKCGFGQQPDSKPSVNGRPDHIRATCEASLKRLQTEHIDLYYLHRRDFTVPIEDSIGALADLQREGKIGAVGVSEIGAADLYKAHAEHPISAVQSEFSLWTRNAEIAVLKVSQDIGAAYVAFSPLARGFLTNKLHDTSGLAEHDLRLTIPRFDANNYPANLSLLPAYVKLAQRQGCTPAQLALAWVVAQGDNVIAIPGTQNLHHLEENIGANDLVLNADVLAELNGLINQQTVHGERYGDRAQASVTTEQFNVERQQ